MKVLPAIDLLGGRVVCLVGGAEGTQTVSEASVPAVWERWILSGATEVHVIDLDAAFGRAPNEAALDEFLRDGRAAVQVGGGIRSTQRVQELIRRGARRVIVGTRALQDPAWLKETARTYPERLMVAVDVRRDRVSTHGWKRSSSTSPEGLLDAIADLPLAGVLLTSIEREGRLEGIDVPLVERVRRRTRLPLHVAGGIASLDDVRALRRLGADAAVLGAALYHDRFSWREAVQAAMED